MRAVLDTSVLIGEDAPGGHELAISVVSLGELHFGVLLAPDARERARRDAQPRRRLADLMVAATAKVHGAVLLTHNAADFACVADIVDVRAPA